MVADTHKTALAWIRNGRAVIPIPHREKAPRLAGWPELRITAETASQYFNGAEQNIGVLLGEPSGGLVDVDLDSDEAARAASYFLPTTFVYGRESRPASHRLYICPGVATKKWRHGGKTLVELRSTGCQSVIPPSVHPDGDRYMRDVIERAPAADITADVLLAALARTAAAALVAAHWPQSARHDAALALSGALLHAGWRGEEVERFLEAVVTAAGDEELADRARAAADTARDHAAGKAVTGWPTLSKVLPAAVVGQVREWLGIEDFPALEAGDSLQQESGLMTAATADITACKLDPVWPGVLWAGKPTLLVGDPGKGKSLATLDIAARVSTGAPWPCSDGRRPPATVLLMSAEDDAADTIVPRLIAAGADRSRIHIVTGVRGQNGAIDWLSIDRHWRELSDGVRALAPRLIVIDPLSAYMGRADSHNEGEVRKVLAGLAELARESRAAVLAVRHFRKGGADTPQGRVIGSVAFTAAARAVYAVTADPEDEQQRLMVCLKCNIAADTVGYSFRIATTAAGDPFIEWGAEHEYRTADELLGASQADGRIANCDACGAEFVGRRDKKYCSAACRKKAYRDRGTDNPLSVPVPDRPEPSRSVTSGTDRDTSGHIGTGTHRPVAVPRQPEQQQLVRQDEYPYPCLNCHGKGCRICDPQIRAKHREPGEDDDLV